MDTRKSRFLPVDKSRNSEVLSSENRQLKARLDALERENRTLKKSIWDMSVRFDQVRRQLNGNSGSKNDDDALAYFDLNSIDGADEQTPTQAFFLSSLKSGDESWQDVLEGRSRDAIRHQKMLFDSMHFSPLSTLNGHSAAVYVCSFSNDGKYLASCSLDKTVRIWHASGGESINTLQGHTRGVADVCWSSDSSQLASGGFDGVIRRWHVDSRESIAQHAIVHDQSTKPPIILTIKFLASDRNMVMVGTSASEIVTIDTRIGDATTPSSRASTHRTSHAINSLVELKENYIASGDAGGALRVWDRRITGTHCVDVVQSTTQLPIVHVAACGQFDAQSAGLIATTSYDNTLRLYRRLPASSSSSSSSVTSSSQILPTSSSTSKNDLEGGNVGMTATRRASGGEAMQSGGGQVNSPWHAPLGLVSGIPFRGYPDNGNETNYGLTSAMLVATGGVDGSVRVCNVGSLVKSSAASSSNVVVDGNASNTLDSASIQTMTGHADRVYGVDFHPRAPLLASASADGTVRLWASTASTLHRNKS